MRDRVRSILRRRSLAFGAVAVLAVLVAAEAFFLVRGGQRLPDVPDASRDIARDFAVAATSFDYRQIDRDIERVLAFGDAGFVDEFRAAMGEDFVSGVVEARRVSVGEVIAGPTVQRVVDGRAVLLVILNQRVASADEDEVLGPPQHVRVAMLVTVETDDDPRVVAVEVL